MSWSDRVHSDRVESELSQAVDKPAIATTNIENPGARWLQGNDNLVEVLPPSRIGHTPEPYPLALPHRNLALSPNTTILVYPRPPRRRQSQVRGRRVQGRRSRSHATARRAALDAVAAIRIIEAEEDGTSPPCVMSSGVTAAWQWDGAGALGRPPDMPLWCPRWTADWSTAVAVRDGSPRRLDAHCRLPGKAAGLAAVAASPCLATFPGGPCGDA